MHDWLLILAGLVTLIAAAEMLVRSAVWIALVAGIDKMVVGLTLVAFGTSAPEISACLTAALDGAPTMATGTAIGSNIANIGLIIGITAIVAPIPHAAGTARFEVRSLVGVSLLMLAPLALGIDLDRGFGVLLCALIIGFTGQLVMRERRARAARRRAAAVADHAANGTDPSPFSVGQLAIRVLMLAVGLAGLKFGGEWLVEGARAVATRAGMSPLTAGQLIVGVGTSLPELATCLVAAKRGHPEIALGNVLGSNIFNICMVLGITSLAVPLPMDPTTIGPTIGVMLVLTLSLAFLLRQPRGISRTSGAMMLAGYAAFATWLALK